MAKLTHEQLDVRRIKDKRALANQKKQILICAGTGCIAGGSLKIYDQLKEICTKRGLDVFVGLTHEAEVEDDAARWWWAPRSETRTTNKP